MSVPMSELTRLPNNVSLIVHAADNGTALKENLLIVTWLKDKSKNTQKAYERVVRQFFSHYKLQTLSTISTTHITAYIFSYLEPLSKATKSLNLEALSSLFRFLQVEGYRANNPCAPIKRFKVERLENIVLPTDAQIDQLFLKARSPRNLAILKILYFGGLRVDELANLQKSDFTELETVVKIRILGKGSKLRFVFIKRVLFEEIKSLLGRNWEHGSPYLFESRRNKGLPLSVRQIENITSQESRNANLSISINPHLLRHKHATKSTRNGAPLDVLQKSLGHTSILTTAQYLHIEDDDSSGLYL